MSRQTRRARERVLDRICQKGLRIRSPRTAEGAPRSVTLDFRRLGTLDLHYDAEIDRFFARLPPPYGALRLVDNYTYGPIEWRVLMDALGDLGVSVEETADA